ncbi:MAG: hypothetical protein RJA22_3036 [Verrucomicrobiota bacterium]
MLRRRLSPSFVAVLFSGLVGGAAALAAAPVEVRVGFFMTRLHQVDFSGNQYSFEGFLWFQWDTNRWGQVMGSGLAGEAVRGPHQTVEVMGAMEGFEQQEAQEKPGYACLKLRGRVSNPWDVRQFPFDQQQLLLTVEDASYESDKVSYVLDAANSGVDEALGVPGWEPGPLTAVRSEHTYASTYGDPDLRTGEGSTYSRATFVLSIAREGWAYGLKVFVGMLVSVGIGFCSLFIRPVDVDPRFGLGVGALFGVVGSEYVVSNIMPDSGRFSLADGLHCLSLVIVLLLIIISTLSLRLWHSHETEGPLRSRAFDRRWLFILLAFYVCGYLLQLQFFLR